MLEVNPVRAILAISSWFGIIIFLALGIDIPDAYWAIAAGINVFYFKGGR